MVVTENKTGRRYKKIGKDKAVHYSTSGRPFFYWGKQRVYFDDVMRMSWPVMYHYEEEGDVDGIIGGYYEISIRYALLVEIRDGGETVRTFEELED